MTTSITEENGTAQATATSEPPKATKKANVAARARHVAPAKAKASKKVMPAKKGAKRRKRAKAARSAGAREGGKTAKVLEAWGRLQCARHALDQHIREHGCEDEATATKA